MPIKSVPRKPDRSAVDGRQIIRSDSRPQGFITSFTSRGDSLTAIGDGKIMEWDFANTDDDLENPPVGYRRKRLEIGFSEKVYIKEGTIYFHGAPKGAYLDLYVVCKTGAYYKDPNGVIPGSSLGLDPEDTYTQAVQDTIITHYINHHPLQGECPMGDELNTEGASEAGMPRQQDGYFLCLEITSPESVPDWNGSSEVEIYRPRTILLPGESL